MSKPNPLDKVMAEHIQMPGFPQIIVTRDFAYQWLKGCGWEVCERGYGSLDYAVFAKNLVGDPLCDQATRDNFLNQVRPDYLRGAMAA